MLLQSSKLNPAQTRWIFTISLRNYRLSFQLLLLPPFSQDEMSLEKLLLCCSISVNAVLQQEWNVTGII